MSKLDEEARRVAAEQYGKDFKIGHAEGRRLERERCKAIILSPEGLKRQKFAEALATQTDMPADQARIVLGASAIGTTETGRDSNAAFLAQYTQSLQRQTELSEAEEIEAILKASRAVFGPVQGRA